MKAVEQLSILLIAVTILTGLVAAVRWIASCGFEFAGWVHHWSVGLYAL